MGVHKLPHYRNCFGCGLLNPIGLKLERFWDDEAGEVFCKFTLTKNYEGFEEIAHGGIISTICDELLWWAIAVSEKLCTVTAEMNIRYKRPVKIGEEYTARAKVLSVRGRRVEAICTIEDEEGRKVAEAKGLFVDTGRENWEKFLKGIGNDPLFSQCQKNK